MVVNEFLKLKENELSANTQVQVLHYLLDGVLWCHRIVSELSMFSVIIMQAYCKSIIAQGHREMDTACI